MEASQALTRVREEPAAALTPRTFDEAIRFSETVARSSFVPDVYRGKPGDILACVIAGHELGIGPMQALRAIHVVKGKPILSADLMVALVKRSGACRYFRLVSSTADEATYETVRDGDPEPTRMQWTMSQARAAGLTNNPTWRAHAGAMLRARCASALARAVYPDLVLGIYDEDEGREISGRAHREPAEVGVEDAAPAETQPRQLVAAPVEREAAGPDTETDLFLRFVSKLREYGLTEDDDDRVLALAATVGRGPRAARVADMLPQQMGEFVRRLQAAYCVLSDAGLRVTSVVDFVGYAAANGGPSAFRTNDHAEGLAAEFLWAMKQAAAVENAERLSPEEADAVASDFTNEAPAFFHEPKPVRHRDEG